MRQQRRMGKKGQEVLRHYEQGPNGGFAPSVYIDDTGNPTIGWGHLVKEGEQFEIPMSRYEADELLVSDYQRAEELANNLLNKIGVENDTQDQFDALVSLIFNCGAGRRDGVKGDIADSTLLDMWAAGDIVGAGNQFLVWNKGRVNGKLVPLKGLTRRRNTESYLFLYGVLKFQF